MGSWAGTCTSRLKYFSNIFCCFLSVFFTVFLVGFSHQGDAGTRGQGGLETVDSSVHRVQPQAVEDRVGGCEVPGAGREVHLGPEAGVAVDKAPGRPVIGQLELT